MSRQKLAIIFSIIFLGTAIVLIARKETMERARAEVAEINECVDFAVTSAIETMRNEYGSENICNMISDEFFRAYGIRSMKDTSDLALYVPAIVFCDTEGYFVGALDPVELEYKWHGPFKYRLETENFTVDFGLDNSFSVESGIYTADCKYDGYFANEDKMLKDYEIVENGVAQNVFRAYSFDFSKDTFFQLKSDAIVLSVQKCVTEYINDHNYITSGAGIKYIYTAPEFYSIGEMNYPSLIVCFQGYPILANNNFFSSLYVRSGYVGKAE